MGEDEGVVKEGGAGGKELIEQIEVRRPFTINEYARNQSIFPLISPKFGT